MKTAKVVKQIGLNLYPRHAEIIRRIESNGENVSEVIRNMILELGEKKYPETPAYVEVQRMAADIRKMKLEKELETLNLDPKVYTKDTLKGEVVGDDAVFCFPSGIPYFVPLAEIKERTMENDINIKWHNQLLDGTYIHVDGRTLGKEECDRRINEWKAKIYGENK